MYNSGFGKTDFALPDCHTSSRVASVLLKGKGRKNVLPLHGFSRKNCWPHYPSKKECHWYLWHSCNPSYQLKVYGNKWG